MARIGWTVADGDEVAAGDLEFAAADAVDGDEEVEGDFAFDFDLD